MGNSRSILGTCCVAILCQAAWASGPVAQRAIDPDAGLPAIARIELRSSESPSLPPSIGLSGSSECEEIGGFDRQFLATNRLRGNWYDFDVSGVLTEIQVHLSLPAPAPLTFFVYKERAGEQNVFDLLWAGESPAGEEGERFYVSPPVGGGELQMDAGASYVIGAGWGPVSVVFGRSDNGVGPFSRGHVRGIVGIDQAPPPPAPEEGLELNDPFNRGAYGAKLCFAPDPGACCDEVDGCRDDLNATECLDSGGAFAGPNTTCQDVSCPLPRWACCVGDSCIDALTRFECENIEGGTFFEGLNCVDEPCSARGACCAESGCVEAVTQRACVEDLQGVYRGDNVECGDFPGCNAGACCLGEFCGRGMSEQACLDAGGVYQGPGSTCDPGVCAPEGACCLGDGTCRDPLSAAACAGLGGTYRGDGSQCAGLDPPCGEGACCSLFGCFDNKTRSDCERDPVFGTWRGDGSTCQTLDPHCAGSCCVNQDVCEEDDWTPELCDQFNGVFLGYGVDCFPSDPCPVGQSSLCCLTNTFTCVEVVSDGVCGLLGGTPGCDTCFECDENSDCDDGVFCNGTETCVGAACQAGTPPCPGQACREDTDECVECLSNSDCPGGQFCDTNQFACVDCLMDAHCDDGAFCNGAETCADGTCQAGAEPCVDLDHCDEGSDACLECIVDGECDDGLFCTGVEACVDNACVAGQDPCPEGERCDEDNDVCVAGCGRDPVWICDGDVDGDGQVNPVDTGLIQSAFGSMDDADLCQYDVDCDGQINPVDSGIVQSLFGTCDPPRAECP